MNLLVALGLQNITSWFAIQKALSIRAVSQTWRKPNAYAVVDDGKRTLDDVIEGADIFLGCSGPKVLTRGNGEEMARAPMITALANLEPEILPPLAKECVRMPSSVPAVPTTEQ